MHPPPLFSPTPTLPTFLELPRVRSRAVFTNCLYITTVPPHPSRFTPKALPHRPPSQAQKLALAKFRSGELNCLISTSVAEEGIDVKQCQLVVRFDLPPTQTAFIQSRGRARVVGSDLVLMVALGNKAELQSIHDIQG